MFRAAYLPILCFDIHVFQTRLVHGIQDLAKIIADRNNIICFCAFPEVTKEFGIEQRYRYSFLKDSIQFDILLYHSLRMYSDFFGVDFPHRHLKRFAVDLIGGGFGVSDDFRNVAVRQALLAELQHSEDILLVANGLLELVMFRATPAAAMAESGLVVGHVIPADAADLLRSGSPSTTAAKSG